MRVLFVNDTGARLGNPGCQLTSRTLEALLGGQHATPISLPWGFARRLKPEGGALWSSMEAGRILDEAPLRQLADLEYGAGATAAAAACDLVLFQPEGTISDHDGILRILRLLSLPLWAAIHGRVPMIVANGTFPLFEDHRASLIHTLLHAADRALMRDRIAARHWQAQCAPDSAVLWQGTLARRDADGLLITTAAEGSVETDLAIGRAGLAAARSLGLRPLVLTKGWQRLVELEGEVKGLGGEIAHTTDLDETDHAIAGCRLHVGGRYHMALLCATKGIPSALVRSNTHKNLWLAEETVGIGLAQTVGNLVPLAQRLHAVDRDVIREDVRRLGEETRRAFSGLPPERITPSTISALPHDTLKHLRREARAQRYGNLLRRLTGR